MKKRLILIVLFLSGAAALVYEVVWFRMLGLLFGSSVYALSTMLVAFLAGLALGSYLIARYENKITNPLRLYIRAELLLAIYGLIVIWMFNLLPAVYVNVKFLTNVSFFYTLLFNFLISFLVLLIPTTFMGATWPLANRIYIKEKEEITRGTGLLYAVNNFGAIAGSLLGGFLFMPFFGISNSSAIAASMNFVSALLLIYIRKKHETS